MRVASGIIVLVAASLVSCAHHHRHHPRASVVEGDARQWGARPNTPQVEIVNNQVIIVDQEPIFIPRHFVDKRITWELVPSGSPYVFVSVTVDAEIETKERAFFDCAVIAGGKRVKCENNGTPGKYKYTLRVRGPATLELDPWIMNGR